MSDPGHRPASPAIPSLLYATGWNEHGECGLGQFCESVPPQSQPFTYSPPNSTKLQAVCRPTRIQTDDAIDSVHCGHFHSMLITSQGDLFTFGNDMSGQCLTDKAGAGAFDSFTLRSGFCWLPEKSNAVSRVACVAAGRGHSVVVVDAGEDPERATDQRLLCCGSNKKGELGVGYVSSADQMNAVSIGGALAGQVRIAALSCGESHSVALSSEGVVWSWGSGGNGRLGTGDCRDQSTPQRLSVLGRVHSVACGFFHSMALGEGGELFTWGCNKFGQLGTGSTTDAYEPQKLTAPAFEESDALFCIAAGGLHSLACSASGRLFSWGLNSNGQLGIAPHVVNHRLVPRRVRIPNADASHATDEAYSRVRVVELAGGALHSLVLCDRGHVFSCGHGKYGQLGLGDFEDSYTFRYVEMPIPGRAVDQVACGNWHSLFLSCSAQKSRDKERLRRNRGQYLRTASGNNAENNAATRPAMTSVSSLLEYLPFCRGRPAKPPQRDAF